MPDPTQRENGNPNLYLTNVALTWAGQQGDAFIADKVFPVVPVNASAAKYRTWARSYFLMDNVGPRPLGGYPRRVGYRMSEDTYSIEEEALEFMVEDRERVEYAASGGPPSGAPESAGTELLTAQHLIHRDRRWADKYFKAGVWGTDFAGIASGSPTSSQFLRWDNDDSEPIDFLAEVIDAVGDKVGGLYRPNKLVLGTKAYRKVRNHPGLLARLGVNNVRTLNRQGLADLLEVDQVLVPQAIVNTGPEKETAAATETAAVYSRIIDPEDALLVYAAAAPSTSVPSAGYTFAWRGLLGAQAFDPTLAVTQGRDGRAYSDWFHVRTAYDFKVVAPELGVFFKDVVS